MNLCAQVMTKMLSFLYLPRRLPRSKTAIATVPNSDGCIVLEENKGFRHSLLLRPAENLAGACMDQRFWLLRVPTVCRQWTLKENWLPMALSASLRQPVAFLQARAHLAMRALVIVTWLLRPKCSHQAPRLLSPPNTVEKSVQNAPRESIDSSRRGRGNGTLHIFISC